MVLHQVEVGDVDCFPLLESILDAIGQGILVVDEELAVVAANRKFKELFAPDDAVPPAVPTLAGTISGIGCAAEIIEHVEVGRALGALCIPVGDTIQEVQGCAVPGTGYLLTFIDVTERARSEQARAEHERRVLEILEHSPIGVNIVGSDGRRRYSNRKIQEMCGYGVDELIGVKAASHYADPSVRERLMQEMTKTGAVENREVEFVRKDGTPFWVLLSCRPFVYDGEDCVLGWVYEITDRVELERKQIRSREELEIQILELRDREDRMADQAAELESLAIRLSESERRMAELANYDGLTGLPTSRLCMDRLLLATAFAKRQQTLTAVFYVDLDGFKVVNDTFGHDAGDVVLKEAARRMNSCFREVDTVARIGGDEFLVVLCGLGFREAAVPLADRLLNCFTERFEFPEGNATIGASVGIAFFNGASDTPESVIKRADKAMYVAKKSGKNRYVMSEDLDA